MQNINPFALVRASDYTDEQINSLWVEFGRDVIERVIEPRSKQSKYILGGKGAGKTHLLRYHAYQTARLRYPNKSGLTVLREQKFIGIFIRATNLDSQRFEKSSDLSGMWQHLFGVYLELAIAEGVLDALCDIKATTPAESFDDKGFISELGTSIVEQSVSEFETIDLFREWVIEKKRGIDDAVNNFAYTGKLDVQVPFAIGALSLPFGRAICKWNQCLCNTPLLYMIDEIENLSVSQQQVLNSLIRYSESLVSFRAAGRLYARKTFSTLSDEEENREGSEFKSTRLDDILRTYKDYPKFAKKFVVKRVAAACLIAYDKESVSIGLDLHNRFMEVATGDLYKKAVAELDIDQKNASFIKSFVEALSGTGMSKDVVQYVLNNLVSDIPLIIQKLNILRFYKKFKPGISNLELSNVIRQQSLKFMEENNKKSSYAAAYGYWVGDLFAQLCGESNKLDGVPYAGFDTFVQMSSGNLRNLLIILGKSYEAAAFNEVDLIHGGRLTISMQTEAAKEAARFVLEDDTNYGSLAGQAREAVKRLALVLRAARYSLNIPEKSPLTVSYSEGDLSQDSKIALNSALNYSLIYYVYSGRHKRNNRCFNKKIQLNPLLSPQWGLPITRGGDIPLNKELLNSIFDASNEEIFDIHLNRMAEQWNSPLKNISNQSVQKEVFWRRGLFYILSMFG